MRLLRLLRLQAAYMDGGDDDMYMDGPPAAAQTISAADMAKLSETVGRNVAVTMFDALLPHCLTHGHTPYVRVQANAAMLDPNGHLMQ